MHERFVFDYAVVRIVPRVDRGEFLNAGVILFSPTAGFLDCRIELDHARLLALAPSIDVGVVESYLEAIPKICAGGGEARLDRRPPPTRSFPLAGGTAQHSDPDVGRALGRSRRSESRAGRIVREARADGVGGFSNWRSVN